MGVFSTAIHKHLHIFKNNCIFYFFKYNLNIVIFFIVCLHLYEANFYNVLPSCCACDDNDNDILRLAKIQTINAQKETTVDTQYSKELYELAKFGVVLVGVSICLYAVFCCGAYAGFQFGYVVIAANTKVHPITGREGGGEHHFNINIEQD